MQNNCKIVTLFLVAIVWTGLAQGSFGFNPQSPDPFLLKAAPEECIAFLHSFGTSAADPKSTNQTERFFADKEVQVFLKAVDKLILDAIATLESEPRRPGQMDSKTVNQTYFWVKHFFTHPCTAYFSTIEFDEHNEPKNFDVGFVLKPGEDMDAARKLIKQLFSQVPKNRLVQTTIRGQKCTEIKPSSTDENEPSVFVAIKGDYLLVTVGNGSMEGLLTRTETDPPKWLSNLNRRLRVPRRSLITHFNLAKVNELIAKVDDPQITDVISALGINNLVSASTISGLDSRGTIFRGSLKAKELTGSFKIFSTEPLSAEDFSHIPIDVDTAVVMRLSPKKVLETIRDVSSKINPATTQQIDQGLEIFKALTNIDVQKDLLDALGDTWTVYQTGVGFMGIPNITATLSVRDRVKFNESLGKLMVMAKAQLAQANQGPEIAETKIADYPAYFLRGLPVAPAWCITESQFVVAISTQELKSHLSRNIQQSVAEKPAVARRLNASRRPIIVSYNDMRSTLERFHAGLPVITNMLASELSKKNIDFDPSIIPSWETISPYIGPSVQSLHRSTDGLDYVAEETLPVSSVASIGAPTSVLLLLPAINAARSAARRNQSLSNIRQLAIAVANHESATKRYPSASLKTKDGKPGLSWRVKILPYLKEQSLYEEFRLDEPWDSDHNKKLINKIPAAYVSPASASEIGWTNYLAIRTDNSIITESDGNLGVSNLDIVDGIMGTLLLVEVNDEKAVPWTKPDDFEWDANDPFTGLGGLHPGGGFVAVFADGHTRFIRQETSVETLKAISTRSGRENVPRNAIK